MIVTDYRKLLARRNERWDCLICTALGRGEIRENFRQSWHCVDNSYNFSDVSQCRLLNRYKGLGRNKINKMFSECLNLRVKTLRNVDELTQKRNKVYRN
jgi:hypothetical protein